MGAVEKLFSMFGLSPDQVMQAGAAFQAQLDEIRGNLHALVARDIIDQQTVIHIRRDIAVMNKNLATIYEHQRIMMQLLEKMANDTAARIASPLPLAALPAPAPADQPAPAERAENDGDGNYFKYGGAYAMGNGFYQPGGSNCDDGGAGSVAASRRRAGQDTDFPGHEGSSV